MLAPLTTGSTSGEEGPDPLRRIKDRNAGLPVILITAWGTIELAVRGMQPGAADFITKPWSNEHLVQALETVLEVAAARADVSRGSPPGRRQLDRRYDFAGIIGRDPKLLCILDLIGRVSSTDASDSSSPTTSRSP